MIVVADIDFETYSEAGYVWSENKNRWVAPPDFPSGKPGLPSIGAARYAEHPSTEVLCLAYDLKDRCPARLWVPGMDPPGDLLEHITNGGLVEAWNGGFEFVIWHYVCHLRLGWPALPLSQVRCAMAKSAAWGLPGKLKDAAKALCSTEQKLSTGDSLIRKLCCPRNPTKTNPSRRLTPETNPMDFSNLYIYCLQDIRAERAISGAVPDLSDSELNLYKLDQEINTRGVQVDTVALGDCIYIVHKARDRYTKELRGIIGDNEITIDSLQQIKSWFKTQNCSIDSLSADEVTWQLGRPPGALPANVRRVLEIRQILGSAGVKKLYALARYVNSDGRVRQLYTYHGARQTGRFAGRGPQPQNMVSGGPDVVQCVCGVVRWAGRESCICGHKGSTPVDWGVDGAEQVLQTAAQRDLDRLESQWGNPIKAVSGCVRALFIAKPGHTLICPDYSAIEAVVLAQLSGEQWRIDVFKTHGKIYEMSASKISGVPFEEFLEHKKNTGNHHPLRKKLGKFAELASGYQGWINAWIKFGADKYMTDAEIKKSILLWRSQSPKIVEFWGGQWRKVPGEWGWRRELYGIEGAAIKAIITPGETHGFRGINFLVHKDVLYCQLLSGRFLTYHEPRLTPGLSPFKMPIHNITFSGWNSDSTKGPVGWGERHTYGGCLTENITQAVARDCFVHGMRNVSDAGYPIVLHTHDEITAEVPVGAGSLEHMEHLMGCMPSWCEDWPIKATGWQGHRYRKD